MTEESVIKQLSRLSPRQREVLGLVCDGLDYKTIGQRLFITESAIKTHMQQVYVRLDLKRFERTERLKILFEEYCPVLTGGLPPPPDEPENPEPVPIEVEEMVEEDEKALALWRGAGPPVPLEPDTIIIGPGGGLRGPTIRRARWAGLLAGLVLGALLTLGILLLSGQLGAGSQTSPEATPATPQVIVAQVTVVVTSTPDPLSASAPVSQTVVVTQEVEVTREVTREIVVTATIPPTPTETANTPEDAVLEVGDWWMVEGVWLRVSEATFGTTGRISITLELWNKTEGQLLFDWTLSGNLSLKDNTEHVYPIGPPFPGGRESDNEIFEAGDLKPLAWDGYPQTVLYEDSYLFNASVTDLYLTVIDLSRITQAQFHIAVPK